MNFLKLETRLCKRVVYKELEVNYMYLAKYFVSDHENVLALGEFSGDYDPGRAPLFNKNFVTCKLLRGKLWSYFHTSK